MEKIEQFGRRSLSEREVHLWFFRDQGETLPEAGDFLDSYELDRLASYKVTGKQREFLAGRWLLKRVLAQYLRIPFSDISFSLNRHGRLETSGGIDINLSHSFGGYCCMLRREGKVGVDIEFLPRQVKTQSVHHVFSPEEIAALEQQNGARARNLFFQIWTLKEAIWKAIDLGNALAFNAFHVSFDPIRVHTHTNLLDTKGWQLNNFLPHPDYMISTAIFAPDHPPFQLRSFHFQPVTSYL